MGNSTSASPHEKYQAPVGFLELFYDLIFVASTMVLSNEFAHDPTWFAALNCGLMFAILWLLWSHTTVLMNVERRDDLGQRGLIFSQMFLIFVATLVFVQRDSTTDLVGAVYLVAVLLVAYSHHRLVNQPDPIGGWARSRRNRLIMAGAVMLIGIVIPDGPDAILYAAAILLLIIPTSLVAQEGRPIPAIDTHYLAERAALLTLIVIGESFVKSALVLSTGTIDTYDVIALVMLFVILFGLFSAYFDDVPKAGIRSGALDVEMWLLSHLLLQLAIVALAVGVSKFLLVNNGPVPTKAVVILMIAYVGIFLGLALISSFDQRVPRWSTVGVHVTAAAVALVAGIATLTLHSITPGMFLVALAFVSIGDGVWSWRVRRNTVVLVDDMGPVAVDGDH
jgi:low temperature requirement protein LtrA